MPRLCALNVFAYEAVLSSAATLESYWISVGGSPRQRTAPVARQKTTRRAFTKLKHAALDAGYFRCPPGSRLIRIRCCPHISRK